MPLPYKPSVQANRKLLPNRIQMRPASITLVMAFLHRSSCMHQTQNTQTRQGTRDFQGKIVLSLTVDTKGNAQDVRVLHSLSEAVDKKLHAAAVGLDEKAVTAVKQYRFDPALFQGKPVSVDTTVEVNYRIY
jgi:TonB family protein